MEETCCFALWKRENGSDVTTTKRVKYTKVAVVWSSDAIFRESLAQAWAITPPRPVEFGYGGLTVCIHTIARKPVTSTQFGCSKNNLIKVFCPVRVNRWDGDEVDGDCEFGHYAAGRAG